MLITTYHILLANSPLLYGKNLPCLQVYFYIINMVGLIEIETQKLNRSCWLKITVIGEGHENLYATLQTIDGELIRKINLSEGVNMVDAVNIDYQSIQVKVETAFETVLKEIQLN
jgi:hypothetical protein